MYAIKLDLVLFLLVFRVSNCDRRITDGDEVTAEKRYVAYLVKAPISPRNYDTWLCGGAIVSREFIITSAACVEDVEFLYAIAGYKKYVTDANIETDPCTKTKKKKVIYTCTPVAYELKYDQLEKWSYIDIALVKVESPYDFNDASYQIECSYIPATIPINYENKYQEPGTDAMVLGWGHKKRWRTPDDNNNYNQEMLHYASTLIENKETCKKQYEVYPNMSQVIDQYMICTLAQGNINDAGETILKSPPTADGCTTDQQKLMGFEGISCEDENGGSGKYDMLMDNTRRNDKNNQTNFSNTTRIKTNQTYTNTTRIKTPMNVTKYFARNMTEFSRRSGICQNDHGGPLVTWVGSHEVLIGVASVFKVSEDNQCIGPYLYTSTQCNGAFLDCVLTNKELPSSKQRRASLALCDSAPSERGYDTVERHISWMYHPAGPADNERKSANSKYRPGNSEKYPDDREDANVFDGYKKIVRHLPETYGGVPNSKDKHGVDEKYAPVKYGIKPNKYGEEDVFIGSKQGAEKRGPEKYAGERNGGEKYGLPNHGPPNHGPPSHRPPNLGPPSRGLPYPGYTNHGPPNHGPDSHRGNSPARFQPHQFPGNDRFRSKPIPQTEQPAPKEKFIMRPQRPLRS